jgi:HlyD family secretion protein
MAKRKSNRLLLVLAISAGALILFLIVGRSLGWIGQEKLPEVETALAKKADIEAKVSASGKIQPEVEVKISPDVPGEITELYVKEGDSVVQGQLLLRIRPDNYMLAVDRSMAAVNASQAGIAQSQAQVAQMEAQYTRSKLDFDRQKRLHEQKVISEADFQTAEANFKVAAQNLEAARQSLEASRYNYQSAQANLRDAQTNLRKTEIFAPVNGTVSKLSVEKGERVVGTSQMSGTEMLRLANLNNMEVQVDVNENDITRVSLEDTAIIDVDSYSSEERKFRGIVTEIANTANQSVSADAVTEFQVKIRILQDSYRELDRKGKVSPFRPGMTASVDIITKRETQTLTVPLSALTSRSPSDLLPANGDKKGKSQPVKQVSIQPADKTKPENRIEVVFVLENGTAVAKKVKTGISDYDNVQVKEGIKEGEEVITGPYLLVAQGLRNGDKVQKKQKDEKK